MKAPDYDEGWSPDCFQRALTNVPGPSGSCKWYDWKSIDAIWKRSSLETVPLGMVGFEVGY
jgi:hypothetical protein